MTETSTDLPVTRRALRAQRKEDAATPPAPVALPAAASVQPPASRPVRLAASPAVSAPRPAAVAPRAARPSRRRRIGAMVMTVAAAGFVGLLAVGMTTPASAVAAADGVGAHRTSTADAALYASDIRHGQAFHATATVENALSRESFATGPGAKPSVASTGNFAPVSVDAAGLYSNGSMILTAAQMLADNGYNASSDLGFKASGWGSNPSPIPAGFSNVSNQYFVNDPGGKVQWPFAVGCPITYGFGWRPGEFHQGADFTPGMGAPIQSIADGVVSLASDNFQGYGAVVVVNHVIDGQRVASMYAHMIIGSIRVHVGERVSVGQELGQVGDTGDSYGANMHFAILENGTTPVDPVGWLRSHAGP